VVLDIRAFFDAELAEHAALVGATRADLREPFAAMVAVWSETIKRKGKVLLFGNGGSAADAQHLAAELTVRYRVNRPAIAAMALTTDSSVLTAAANDFGYARVFSRQIEALGKPGDLAFGISTSGRSENVVHALETARSLGLRAAALTGGDGGLLRAVADPILIVPSESTARIQEMHITLGQMLCAAVEIELGFAE
jgi:D-sedoheptulose 7-phosphate isomerase